MGCCPWALALGLPRHKGETVQHWWQRWVEEAGSVFGLGYFSYISWRALSLTLSSTEAISCWSVGHVFFGPYQYWRLWGAQCKSTLWIHRSTSIHDSWWRSKKQSIQLSSCSAVVHIQLIYYLTVLVAMFWKNRQKTFQRSKSLDTPTGTDSVGKSLAFWPWLSQECANNPFQPDPCFIEFQKSYSVFLQVPIQHVTKKQSIASIGKFYE